MPASMMNRKGCIQNKTYYADKKPKFISANHRKFLSGTLRYFLSESVFLILIAVPLWSMTLILFIENITIEMLKLWFYLSMPDYGGMNKHTTWTHAEHKARLKATENDAHLEKIEQTTMSRKYPNQGMRLKHFKMQCIIAHTIHCFKYSFRQTTSCKTKLFGFSLERKLDSLQLYHLLLL